MIDINPAIGIDLGTTNTVVSIQIDSTGPVILEIPQPVDERNRFENLPQIKSAVFFENKNSAVVGSFANNRIEAFRSVKSHMGTRWRGKNPATNEFVSPAYISAHILKLAHQTIINRYKQWDQTALITVPASFNTDQRNDTIAAAEMAGFSNVRLLDEPTAAFYYFFNQNIDSGYFDKDQYILVFDFGGGTLDVSVIFVTNKNDEIILDAIGRSRYNNLGGDDIDLEMAAFMLGCWEYESEQELTVIEKELKNRLYKLFVDKASNFKEETEDYLKFEDGIPEFFIMEDLHVEDQVTNINFRRQLNINQYEDITAKFLQPKSDLNIYRPIEEAITVANNIDSNFSKNDLNLVLYTGGTSIMKSVQRAIKAHFAGKHCFSIDEEEACSTVALGAAACRYDEMYGNKNVSMRNRLLESIFTRFPNERTYRTLVPLTCEPSKSFNKIEGNFSLHRSTIRFRLPLFRGVSSNDHQLAPIRDLEIPLDKVLEANTPYELYYRMTENKTIALKVIFKGKRGSIEKTADFALFDDKIDSRTKYKLCEVNPV
jgi:molecular chaperone DnaK